MGLYDQFLANTQQGLALGDQYAMQNANRPTMADVFMDRFRQAGQDRLQAEKVRHDMALNDVYKQSQMQQMAANAEAAKRNRDVQLMEYVSKNLSGQEAYPSVVDFVTSQGGSASMVPKMQYETSSYQTESTPVFPEASLSEGGEDTLSAPVTTKTPIRYSDMGAQYGMQQKKLDQQRELAELSLNQKMMIEQAKRERPQDPLGKLTESFLRGQIRPEDYFAMKDKMFFIANPAAGPAATSGYQIAPGLNSRGSSPASWSAPMAQASTVEGPSQPMQPGIAQQTNPSPAIAAKTAGARPGASKALKPLPKKIEEMAAEKSAYEAADSKLAALDQFIDKEITGNKAYASALSPAGLILGKVPKTGEYGVIQNIEVLKNKIMLEAMDALKNASKTGATGMGQLSEKEGETLRNSIAALNSNMSKADFDNSIKLIKSEIVRLRGLAKNRLNSIGETRGLGGQTGETPRALTLDEYLASRSK